MNYLSYFSTIIILSLLPSCNSYLAAPSPVAVPTMMASARSADSRVLIKTGTIRIEVNDVENSTQLAKKIVKKHKGYLENISTSDDDHAYARLKLRIPKNQLSPAMDELASLGKVTSRDVEIEDVTDEWIDLQAKLKNLRALRDRLRVLLRQAKNVKETLEVEKELTRVQSELDSLEGRIKAMGKHVTYSKLSLTIRQKTIPGPIGALGKGAWWGVKKLFVLR
ncbi:MAG: DUF4349 domain-containing protein [Akkermansiaceae bacterium]